jgi:hypothetical protein
VRQRRTGAGRPEMLEPGKNGDLIRTLSFLSAVGCFSPPFFYLTVYRIHWFPRSTFRPLHLDTPSGRPEPLVPLPGIRFADEPIMENHIFVQLWHRISSGECGFFMEIANPGRRAPDPGRVTGKREVIPR